MKKLANKEARPITDNDQLEIIYNWDPLIIKSFIQYGDRGEGVWGRIVNRRFLCWAKNNCEGRWYYRELNSTMYFSNKNDSLMFKLWWF